MVKIVLVHGAWHGAWCWYRVAPLLAAAGHQVIAPDLPGLGGNHTPLAALAMADWTNAILYSIAATPEPAILVGHSRGGAVIGNAAELRPWLVSRLIYLSAFLLADGQSVLDAAQLDPEHAPPAVELDAAQIGCVLPEAEIVPRFYADCSQEDIAFAKARLRPEPLFGLTSKPRLTQPHFGTVPKDYIECSENRAISLRAQRLMQRNWPVQRIHRLATSHSPFFSAPEALANILLDAIP